MIKAKHPIIGLTGLKGSGKDTFADALCANHNFERLSFAGPLKVSAAAALGTTVEILNAHKNNPHAYVKLIDASGTEFGNPALATVTVREFLQRYGTEAHREVFGDDFWITPVVDEAFNIAAQYPVVITDARFANEQLAIRNAGGWIIRIERDGTDEGDGHASEQVEHGLTDIVVPNNGTIADLAMAARVVTRDIKLGRVDRAS